MIRRPSLGFSAPRPQEACKHLTFTVPASSKPPQKTKQKMQLVSDMSVRFEHLFFFPQQIKTKGGKHELMNALEFFLYLEALCFVLS